MITSSQLIGVLFAVMVYVSNSTTIPMTDKAAINETINKTIQSYKQTVDVQTNRTVLKGGTKIVEIDSPRKASQGALAGLSIGPKNADDTRTVSFIAMDAMYGRVELYAEAPRGWTLIERKSASYDGQPLFFVEGTGLYKWQVVSLDASGLAMGTTTGKFNINQ